MLKFVYNFKLVNCKLIIYLSFLGFRSLWLAGPRENAQFTVYTEGEKPGRY